MLNKTKAFLIRAKTIDGFRVEGYPYCQSDKYYVVQEIENLGGEGCIHTIAFEVDPSTIDRCSGLVDKYDSLIYENDIVEFMEKLYRVEFDPLKLEWWLIEISGNPVPAKLTAGVALECEVKSVNHG